jgi:endonuclease/exonuclease/phosphatase family metal-dependent hydrolase
VLRLVSWNIGGRDLLRDLDGLDADVALLQEARSPSSGYALEVVPDDLTSWSTAGWEQRAWRTAVARLSDRVELEPVPNVAWEAVTRDADWVVSRQGTVTAAHVKVAGRTVFTAASVYAVWEQTRGAIYADGSAHRILSDLSALMPAPNHRLLIAGDWNVLLGYGEYGNSYFKDRYATVFARAEALGLRFVGPQHPNGRQADPWPGELPTDSRCVPTYHHNRQTPATATRQLDFVFASRSLADAVSVRALNALDEWGSSDHCRVLIDVDA